MKSNMKLMFCSNCFKNVNCAGINVCSENSHWSRTNGIYFKDRELKLAATKQGKWQTQRNTFRTTSSLRPIWRLGIDTNYPIYLDVIFLQIKNGLVHIVSWFISDNSLTNLINA